jgi:dienelactone hydrolase
MVRHVIPLALLMAAALARAEIRQEPIDYQQADHALQGVLVYDDRTSEPRPAVLVCPEWYGVNDFAKGRATELAKMGYVAFVVDPYGKGVNAKSVEEAGKMSAALKADRATLKARVRAAFDVVQKHKRVDPQRIAAIGYCFGGTTALELARSGADVKGVASFHGSLNSPNAEEAKAIKGKVLVLHGGADPFVPDPEVADFVESMRRHSVNYQLNIYGGAVHSFTNPNADKAGLKGVAYNEQADKRSWAELKIFLDEIFRR